MLDKVIDIVVIAVTRLLLAGTTLVIGLYLIKRFSKIVEKAVAKTKLDNTLKPFVASTLRVLFKVFLVLAVIKILGVPLASVIAVIGAAAFAIGLAFQGALSHFAGGVMLLIFRPMRVGDFVEVGGKSGLVSEIQLFSTKLITVDNKVIFIPNSNVLGSQITNYSMMETRRVDQVYGVGYESDIDKVKEVLAEEISKIPEALKLPEPFIALSEHADSSINFVIRVWVKTEDYWTVHFALLENIKKRFDEENINIPYPVITVKND